MMAETTGSLTSGGTMANMNPRWLAPEVLKGGRATVSSDVFAVGIILWGALHTQWAALASGHCQRLQ